LITERRKTSKEIGRGLPGSSAIRGATALILFSSVSLFFRFFANIKKILALKLIILLQRKINLVIQKESWYQQYKIIA